jgi:hypothetical protein
MIASQRTTVALLTLSLVGLTECHKPASSATKIKLDGPALATLLFSGDGWGEYAPCG